MAEEVKRKKERKKERKAVLKRATSGVISDRLALLGVTITSGPEGTEGSQLQGHNFSQITHSGIGFSSNKAG